LFPAGGVPVAAAEPVVDDDASSIGLLQPIIPTVNARNAIAEVIFAAISYPSQD